MTTPFKALEVQLNLEVLERQEEIHTAMLALVARRHHFQVGPPGTAKSFLVSRLAAKIGGLPEHGYFHYLLTQFTVPGELFGPPNLLDMKDKGIYRLNTEGKLPRAWIAFLDEIFKGNSSILNALLTIMNERKFNNSTDDPNIPLISIFGASNEMPQGENLNAMWDRLHFRHEVKPLQETTNFVAMLKQETAFVDEPMISLDQIVEAQRVANLIPLSDNCMSALLEVRKNLRDEGIEPTERRWMDCIPIIKAEAYLSGKDTADIAALRPLSHVLWGRLDHQQIVQRIILQIASPIDKEASILYEKLVEVKNNLRAEMGDKNNPMDQKKQIALGVDLNQKLSQAKQKYEDLRDQQVSTGTDSTILPKCQSVLNELKETLVSDLFQLDTTSKDKAIKKF